MLSPLGILILEDPQTPWVRITLPLIMGTPLTLHLWTISIIQTLMEEAGPITQQEGGAEEEIDSQKVEQ